MYRVFAIKDEKVGKFGNIFTDQSDVAAVRGFSMAVNSGEGLMNYAPADFGLYYVGNYDNEKGILVSEPYPRLLVSGSDVFGK